MNRFSSAAAAALTFALACTAPTEGAEGSATDDPETPEVSYCTRTICQDVVVQCEADWDSDCSSCFSACSYSGDCSICADICSQSSGCGSTCSPRERKACNTFDFSPLHDPEVYDACTRMAAACGAEGHPCDKFARVESPSVVPVYDCFAADCGGTSCAVPAPHDITPLCDAIAECGEWVGCTDFRTEMAAGMGWLRPEVLGALDDCLGLTCDARLTCITGWLEASGLTG